MQQQRMMIVGAGLMGTGIAAVAARAGYRVALADRTEQDVELSKQRLAKSLSQLQKKHGLTREETLTIEERISFTTRLSDGHDAELVIEAVSEHLQVKQSVFKELDQAIHREAVLASNTSTLSIAAIGSVTSRPDRVIGMHFFSPVPMMDLLELIPSLNTSEATIDFAQRVGEKLGKQRILAQDTSGFIVNRLLVPMLNEAAYLVMEGNEPEDVDKGLTLGANHPIGPLRLADNVGIDIALAAIESLYDGFGDSKYRPCPLLKRMVEAGRLGKKTGRGFYTYEPKPKPF